MLEPSWSDVDCAVRAAHGQTLTEFGSDEVRLRLCSMNVTSRDKANLEGTHMHRIHLLVATTFMLDAAVQTANYPSNTRLPQVL